MVAACECECEYYLVVGRVLSFRDGDNDWIERGGFRASGERDSAAAGSRAVADQLHMQLG